MSDQNTIPDDLTLEQVIGGIEKFIVTIEEEVEIHYSHPEWMDWDKRCREEENLFTRVGLIITMLEETINHFNLPTEHPLCQKITAVKNYFDKLN